jgi:hypothetical protein
MPAYGIGGPNPALVRFPSGFPPALDDSANTWTHGDHAPRRSCLSVCNLQYALLAAAPSNTFPAQPGVLFGPHARIDQDNGGIKHELAGRAEITRLFLVDDYPLPLVNSP